MDIKKLRLLNLVYKIDRYNKIHLPIEIPMQILEIGLFECEILEADKIPAESAQWQRVDNFDLSPIPISDKWLEILKFNKGELQEKPCIVQKYFLKRGRNRFNLHHGIQELNNIFRLEINGVFIKDLELKYVHELQNIIFDLTGK